MTQQPQVVFELLSQMACPQCGCRLDIADVAPFSVIECPECGNQDTVPAKFGSFQILNLINTGGMGGVYRARDVSLGRLVAIKVLLESVGADQQFLDSFRREAQAAARLNHPNVAQIYSFGEELGQPFIVMELVSGKRFDRLIETPEPMDIALVLKIGVEIAEGLKAADEIGLIHGDIKPENILLDEKKNAKLVDFGVASFSGVHQAVDGIWGTPYYIAPEKVKRQKADARSDIYSLGATLYHALSGKAPFQGGTSADVVKARLNHMPRPLDTVRKDVPKPVSDTIQRMLQTEPALRHPTYASLISDLRRHLKEYGGESGGLKAHDGRKIFVKKPGGAGASTALPPPSSSIEDVREPQPRLRLVGGGAEAGGGRGSRMRSGIRGVGRLTRRPLSRLSGGGEEGQEQGSVPRPRKKNRVWIPLVIVASFLVLGGLATGIYKWRQVRKAEQMERYRQNAVQLEVRRAVDAIEKVQKAVAQLGQTARGIDVIVTEALGIVEFVEGKPMDSFSIAAPAVTLPPVPGVSGAAPDKTGPDKVDEDGRDKPFGMPSRDENAQRVEASQVRGVDMVEHARILRETEAAKAAAADDPVSVDEEGRARPFGMPVPKPAPADPAAAPAAPADPAAASAAPAAPADPAAPAAPAAADEDPLAGLMGGIASFKSKVEKQYKGPEAVTLAAGILGCKEYIGLQQEKAAALIAEAEAQQATVPTTLDPVAAAAIVETIAGKTEDMKRLTRNMTEGLADANKRLLSLRLLRRNTEQERERVARETEAAKREEERRQLAASEVQAAQAMGVRAKDAVLTWRIGEAVAEAKAALETAQTDEGKSANTAVRDRFQLMLDLQAFIIKSINEEPWSWGWQNPGGGREDIVAATEEGIILRSKRTVAWKAMSPQRFLLFVDHYVPRPRLVPSLRAAHLLGAGLLAKEHGLQAESQSYRDKAVSASRHISEDADRLMAP